MSLEDALYTQLTDHVGLAALVSTRVYLDQLPLAATLPAVKFFCVSTEYVHSRDSALATLRRSRYQFDVYAATHSAARSTVLQVEAALASWSQASGPRVDNVIVADDSDLYDEEPERYRCIFDVHIWHSN